MQVESARVSKCARRRHRLVGLLVVRLDTVAMAMVRLSPTANTCAFDTLRTGRAHHVRTILTVGVEAVFLSWLLIGAIWVSDA